MSSVKRLYRSTTDRMLGGVCGGVAEYFKVDPTLVRLAWILLTLAWGAGLFLYIIAWIILPEKNNFF
jgi:phage shock protein PspC (stress-responsive transcriptional regulator)